jgi:hypothetical protein
LLAGLRLSAVLPGSADGEITEQTLTGRVAIERVIGNTMETSSADMESYGVR